ncbi:uncharacterized protein BDR25DRAFT_349599 [Lindgomyces ingoldianus]|uniref:Uncharacterized protein n=1 Tax=Lindgomyces ingoldianus TaxID=673940 RepID=A0ACB6RBF7_9PLEO|nr:uncharacterized protein BDR25DRAFT_349599 [Lindgomyces ingoldianus]KAF2476521.1 hypothetical protein BDR25DRAFT_349599 [Lindgomyces ingoldianus]
MAEFYMVEMIEMKLDETRALVDLLIPNNHPTFPHKPSTLRSENGLTASVQNLFDDQTPFCSENFGVVPTIPFAQSFQGHSFPSSLAYPSLRKKTASVSTYQALLQPCFSHMAPLTYKHSTFTHASIMTSAFSDHEFSKKATMILPSFLASSETLPLHGTWRRDLNELTFSSRPLSKSRIPLPRRADHTSPGCRIIPSRCPIDTKNDSMEARIWGCASQIEFPNRSMRMENWSNEVVCRVTIKLLLFPRSLVIDKSTPRKTSLCSPLSLLQTTLIFPPRNSPNPLYLNRLNTLVSSILPHKCGRLDDSGRGPHVLSGSDIGNHRFTKVRPSTLEKRLSTGQRVRLSSTWYQEDVSERLILGYIYVLYIFFMYDIDLEFAG